MKKITAFPEKLTSLGEGLSAENASWSFGGETAQSFDEHIRKSIPLYEEGHHLIVKLSDYFIQEQSLCYELGTSTGELLFKLAQHHKRKKQVQWVGIDSVSPMIEKARQKAPPNEKISFVHNDICTFAYEKTDLILSSYCLQFIPPFLRQELVNKIYESLNWGGAFILFEKVRAPDARFQDYMTGIYTDYKIEQGYSPNEIVAKSRSLKRILEPFSTQGNLDLLKRAGFVDYMSVMKYACFEGFLAVK